MKTTVQVEGLKELDAAIREMRKRTGRAVLRRTLLEAAEPLARKMRQLAPKHEFHLVEGIGVARKLTSRQASLHRQAFANMSAAEEVFVGSSGDPAGIAQEFGTVDNAPQPFARPAWMDDKEAILQRIRVALWDEISKAQARAAKAK